MENNLLTEQWLSVENPQGAVQRFSLPELFSALERNEVAAFPALRPHQAAPFHVWLVQLVCHALETAGQVEKLPPPDPQKPWAMLGRHSPDEWRDMIRGIVPDYSRKFPHDEPWRLVTDDLNKPAFMQVPAPEGKIADYRGEAQFPDDLDLLISSKNFDVKSGVMKLPSAEEWVFALISLQTNSGYGGPKLYGIARQNKGTSIRPILTLQSSSSPGARWGRDARVILNCPSDWELYAFCQNEKEIRLLWLEPWDGKTSFALRDLHPLFLEICRRIRVVHSGNSIIIKKATSECTRVDIEKTGGNLRDPWEPIVLDKEGSHVFGKELNYANLAKILADGDEKEEIQKPLLLRYHKGIDDPAAAQAWCSALMKEKGKTKGHKELLIPVNVTRMNKNTLRTAASNMINLVETAKNTVLGAALARFMQCGKSADGSKAIDCKSVDVQSWLPVVKCKMEDEVETLFFRYLWDTCSRISPNGKITDKKWLVPWKTCLRRLVRKYYEIGVSSLPGSVSQSVKARALSELTLGRLLAIHLKTAEEEEG
ncbi:MULTISPECIES: type I-E CRISPR-associated protein Cse1/CasA [unclassified Pyramidobacter]|uniref:type I-E CRISPR-associated protein Cse1/CasA n=1 Tax=unclassified Pyramidobacter TaxID=2632171 RepID=UPI0013154259|nr:type I-E CRISPR-associated protein Cse1/CasA [Pyramidobacter sp. CG50-2]